jgi:hypothetical protein
VDIKTNERIGEIIKNNEKVMVDFVEELKTKLEEKVITIDGIEEIMLNTLNTLKKGVTAAAEEIMSEEGKKNRNKYMRKMW